MEYLVESQSILKNSFYVEKNIGKSSIATRHFHPYYEFYYLNDGNIDYLVDDKVYKLTAGSLVIIPPYTIHRNVDSEAQGHIRTVIYLDSGFSKLLDTFDIKLLSEPFVQFYDTNKETRIGEIMVSLGQEYIDFGDMNMSRLLILELLSLLSRKERVSYSTVEKKMSDKPISKIISYINSEYATEITLESLAAHFGLNPTYLSRFFKKETGFNFSVYLNNLRISKAVHILNATEYNITETALSVGFHSCNHFCKIFKQIMGISPLAFKKLKR